jgi:hypothetical protein
MMGFASLYPSYAGFRKPSIRFPGTTDSETWNRAGISASPGYQNPGSRSLSAPPIRSEPNLKITFRFNRNPLFPRLTPPISAPRHPTKLENTKSLRGAGALDRVVGRSRYAEN